MNVKKISLAFGLIFLCSMLHAADSYMDVCGIDSFDEANSKALSFIGVAFILVATAIAFAYMYSHFKVDPAMGVWAKDEASNLLISILLFAGLLLFFRGSCELAKDYVGGGDPFTVSNNYLVQLLRGNGQNLMSSLTASSMNDQLDATWYWYFGFAMIDGGGAALRADKRAHSAHKEYLMDLYLPIIASLEAQRYMLQVIKWVGASVLLPFAFILRLIPMTREFGNMLIAVFFGVYILVPTMYAMSGKVFTDAILNPASPSAPSFNSAAFCSYGLDGSGPSVRDCVFFKIGSTLPQAIFIPNLVLVVTVTCITALSKALRAFAV